MTPSTSPPSAAIATSVQDRQAVDGGGQILDGEEGHGAGSRAPEEEPGGVGGGDGGGVVEDHHPAGLDRDAGEPGGGGAAQGARADGGEVHAAVLAGLRRLVEHAARRRAPLGRGAGDEVEQGVGALDRLEAEADAAGDHRRLADVGGAERRDDGGGAVGVGAVGVGGGVAAEDAGGGDEVGEDGVRRLDGEALGLEDAGDEAQGGVVAAADAARRAAARGAAS